MNYARRGMVLENMVEYTNNLYKQKGMALVDKVPTPWAVSYDKRARRVRSAHPQKKGTVDFIGISNGRSIAFDAKSTNNKTSFPLNNIEQHQVDYLKQHREQGGASFLLVYFAAHDEAYYLGYHQLIKWWEGQFKGERKSIPYDWFLMHCDQIKTGRGVPLDYLERIGE